MKSTIASNIEWKKWGEKDPLMGVATRTGRARGGPNAWTEAEFYELGRSDWEDFAQRWKRYGLNSASCLEIGCGTGRITRQLVQHFDRVYALDISEGMLQYARERIAHPNAVFMLGDGTGIDLPDAAVTAAFSSHVFQHFDSLALAERYFDELGRVLAPGGTLMIHLPVHQWPAMPRIFRAAYQFRKRVGDLRAWGVRQFIRLGVMHHFMRGLSYEIEYLFDRLPRSGLRDVEIGIFRTTKEDVAHAFVFARRTSLVREH